MRVSGSFGSVLAVAGVLVISPACSDSADPADTTGDASTADASRDASTADASREVPSPSGSDASIDAPNDGDAPLANVASVQFTVEPRSGYSAAPLGAVTVVVRDDKGAPVAPPASVTLSLAPGGGPGALGGTTTKATTAGLTTFEDLTISKAGTYQLVATVQGVTAQSASFTVDAWAPWSGSLTGGTVRRIVVDPTDANIAYAMTDFGGIFRTTDGAASWACVAFPATRPVSMAIAPSTPATVYAGRGEKGLYRSVDRGLSWTPANVGHSNELVTALAVDPTDAQVVYWGTRGLLKSTDGGGSWSPASDPAFATAQVTAIAVAPSLHSLIYLYAAGQPMFRSLNGGVSWSAMNGLPADVFVKKIAVHPTNPTTVYVALGDDAGVWRSTAGGPFTQIATGPVATARVHDIVIVPGSPETMYIAAYGSDVYKSTDGGSSWTPLGDYQHDTGTAMSLAVAPNQPSKLYVGHFLIAGGGGLSKSDDGGATWMDASKGVTAFDVHGIAVDPTGGALWVGGGSNGLNRSSDGGMTYTRVGSSSGLDVNGDFAIARSPTTPGTLFLGLNGLGLFKSTNAGVSFVHDAVLGNVTLSNLAPSPASASTMYVAGPDFGLAATSNGGAVWTTRTANPYASGVAAHPTIASRAYGGLSDGLYGTTDSGVTWTKITTVSPAVSSPRIAFDSANNLYVAARSSVQSSPDGNVWTNLTTSASTTIPVAESSVTYAGVFAIGGEDVLFVGLDEARALWRRGGGTWAVSLPAGVEILTMAQDPAHPKTLYAGTRAGGLYRSLSGGE
jgi:photosystem II stability/assembly factor-like uncharacterized protein